MSADKVFFQTGLKAQSIKLTFVFEACESRMHFEIIMHVRIILF
jgi:hypothetical protein